MNHFQALMRISVYAALTCACTLTFASTNAHEAVAKKFGRDKASLKQFLFFGKMHCLDRYVGSSDNFTSAYGIAFNYLYPLPRIFKQEAFGEYFNKIEGSQPTTKLSKNRKKQEFIDPLEVCSKIYRPSSENREVFKTFVRQGSSLHSADDVDIDVNMQDYLNGFYVRSPQ